MPLGFAPIKSGFADVLIGLQYGDEGKAKVIDLIARDYDIIARFNGGANAGHTIVTEKGPIALHQIPSGIFYPDKLLYIGSGCVIDMAKLVGEIESVKKLGISLDKRLFISSQASIVQPHHILVDILTASEIGTTKNGIGPAYADKAMRMVNNRLVNIKIGDLLENPELFTQIETNLLRKIKKHNVKNYDVKKTMAELKSSLKILIPYIAKDTLFLQRLVEKGKKTLFEGAQSVMLDITQGLVPYVTSSSTAAGAAFVGGDVPLKYHRKTIGVAKVIMSRVGNGPFVSEFGGEESDKYCGRGIEHNKDYEKENYDAENLLRSNKDFEIGIALRMLGDEYGSTTNRPRRIGALDLVQLSYTAKMNGVDAVFLNKCDLLTDFAKTKKQKIPVITEYSLQGKQIDYVPASNSSYKQVKVNTEYLSGFTQKLGDMHSAEKLPKELLSLIKKIEEATNSKIMVIVTGPKREEYILF